MLDRTGLGLVTVMTIKNESCHVMISSFGREGGETKQVDYGGKFQNRKGHVKTKK